ncbi:MAG: sugar transferase [Limisphaerales bacterium]
MIAPRTRGRVYLQSFMDALITFSTFWAYLFVFILLQPRNMRATTENLGASLIYSLVGLVAVMLQGFRTIYTQPQWWSSSWSESHKLSLNQVTWVGLALCVAIVAMGDLTSSRAFLFLWLPILYVCLLLANRFLPRKITETVYDGRLERTMLLGNMESVNTVTGWRQFQERVDADMFDYVPDFSIAGMATLERVMRDRNVTQIILLEVPELKFNLNYILEISERVGARVLLFSEVGSLFRHKVAVSEEAGLQFIGLKDEPLELGHHRFLKRTLDLAVAGTFLVFWHPLLLLAWILQQTGSRGPIFTHEPRAGLNGKVFNLLRFRTRHLDGSEFWFGKLLCWLKIDEWAQIFNVLRGEMSVVGPRGHWPEQHEEFARVLRNYYIRSDVKPGITGLAQVRGFRGRPHSEEEIVRRVEADVEYVENWSLGLDLMILTWTVWQCGWTRK